MFVYRCHACGFRNSSNVWLLWQWTTLGTATAIGTYQQNLHGSHYVHGRGYAGAKVEQDSYRTSKLWPQGSGYHEVWPSPRHHTICCNGAHGNCCSHGLKWKRRAKVRCEFKHPHTAEHSSSLNAVHALGSISWSFFQLEMFRTWVIHMPQTPSIHSLAQTLQLPFICPNHQRSLGSEHDPCAINRCEKKKPSSQDTNTRHNSTCNNRQGDGFGDWKGMWIACQVSLRKLCNGAGLRGTRSEWNPIARPTGYGSTSSYWTMDLLC